MRGLLYARSVLFTVLFMAATAAFVVIGSPLLLGPRSWAMAGLRAHAHTICFLMRLLIGTKVEVRGREKLPPGAALIASKHQSAWDTMGLVPIFKDPALIMKAELMLIPFYGWFSKKFGMIAVKREAGPAAMRQLVKDSRSRADLGRHIIIFPEGTRRAPDEAPDYKPGVVLLYEALKVPCVPVALNSGLFWPRRQILKRPGTIVVEILDPLPAGLPRKEFRERLETAVEAATKRLVAEGRAELANKGYPELKENKI